MSTVVVLDLSELMDNCPLPWQNFVYSLPVEDRDEYNGYANEILDKHLARLHARYCPSTDYLNSKVKFETEADLVAFRIMYG